MLACLLKITFRSVALSEPAMRSSEPVLLCQGPALVLRSRCPLPAYSVAHRQASATSSTAPIAAVSLTITDACQHLSSALRKKLIAPKAGNEIVMRPPLRKTHTGSASCALATPAPLSPRTACSAGKAHESACRIPGDALSPSRSARSIRVNAVS